MVLYIFPYLSCTLAKPHPTVKVRGLNTKKIFENEPQSFLATSIHCTYLGCYSNWHSKCFCFFRQRDVNSFVCICHFLQNLCKINCSSYKLIVKYENQHFLRDFFNLSKVSKKFPYFNIFYT